jgi:hypothetical protein
MVTQSYYTGPLAQSQERRIVESLEAGAKTMHQLCAALGLKGGAISGYLRHLRQAPRRVYVCGHEPRHGRAASIFAAGDKPDVEFVPLARPAPKVSAAQRRQQVLELLVEKPRSRAELAECMHLVTEAAGRYVTELRRPECRQLYIVDWRHPSELHQSNLGGDWTPVYAVGTKPDKKKPVEGRRARHARLQKDPEYRHARNVKRRARYAVEKHTKKKQGIFAALGL